MNCTELISNYKLPFTPLHENASTIGYYKRNILETSSFAPVQKLLIFDANELNIFNFSSKTLQKYNNEAKEREYIKLNSEFIEKWKLKKSNFIGFKESFVFENIKKIFFNLLSLSPSYITFSLTNDCSVLFQSLIDGKNVYLELFFDNEIDNGVEAITNIYKNGECVFAYGSSIEQTFFEISSKVNTNIWYEATMPIAYELSESSFATAELY